MSSPLPMLKRRQLFRLVLDFDGTLTKKDTLHLVAQAGYNRQRHDARQTTVKPWQDIVDAYIADYSNHEQMYKPEKHKRQTIESESMWLNSLKPIEDASAQRVYEAGVFDHVTAEDMYVATTDAVKTGEVQLRSGWAELFDQVNKMNEQVTTKPDDVDALQIVSVNWSRHFIWSILQVAIENARASANALLAGIAIYANEIPSIAKEAQRQTNNNVKLHGGIRDLRVSEDKLEAMSIPMRSLPVQDTNWLTIYIGDSSTDLQCLLSSNVGICVRDEPISHGQKELLETLLRLRVSLKHISECSIADIGSKKLLERAPPCLWWCKDFHEVRNWLEDAKGQNW